MELISPKEIPILDKIKRIETVVDLAQLAGFVFSTIPHGIDNGIDIECDVVEMYKQFMDKKKFGWCYWHAIYMHLLLKEYNRESFLYDYGLQEEQLTHSVVIVTLKDKKYLIDPYFNRYYITMKNVPLLFHELLSTIKKDPNNIGIIYGKEKKQVRQGDKYVKMTPEEFVDSVMGSWKINQNYDEIMMDKFNNKNPFLLIPEKIQKVVVLKKLDGSKYYEFF
jgi:hypothetical protein